MSGNNNSKLQIMSPLAGELVPILEVKDPTFAEEMLGRSVAIRPTGRRVVSPINGVIKNIFNTSHALTLVSDDGTEMLIHIGLDTVKLKGEYFTVYVKNGDKVNIGDVLVEFDAAGIHAAGFDTITPIVICNSEDYKIFEVKSKRSVQEGEELICLWVKSKGERGSINV